MSGPFMIGRRIQLRPFEMEDAPTLAAWINDPEIRHLVLARFPQSDQSEREWIASMSGKNNPRDLAFGVERKSDRRLIGSIGLHAIDWVQRRAMTGMFIYSRALRGKGLGTEAKNLLLDYAFGELGMLSLWAITHDGNEASSRALLKQGYKQGGRFRKAALVNGERIDSIYFDILREEWAALRASSKRGAGTGARTRAGRDSRTRPAAKRTGR
jgi:RimJ/RimL family protein N-acetyltransferase